MKVLWIVNMFVGALAINKGIKLSSGQWLNVELKNSYKKKGLELIICTSGESYEELIDENIKYIVVPHGPLSSYTCKNDNIKYWDDLFKQEKPDLILIWGTEYLIGQCALIANNHRIRSCIYIQGVMSSIAENYRGGLSDSTINSFSTFIERIRHKTIFDQERTNELKAIQEERSVNLTDGVIVENQWAAEKYKSINPNIQLLWNRLPINSVFTKYNWSENGYNNHSIITTAAGYPLKGLHFLLEALYHVKVSYPDVKLIIPGTDIVHTKGLASKLKQSGYGKYLSKLIIRYGLTNNVTFVGILSPDKYAQAMAESEIFVSASAIENHCSALREAMTVGVPCISSKVGGISDYAKHNENALLYTYNQPKELAKCIMQLFASLEMKTYISQNAQTTIREMYSSNKLDSLFEIYKKMKS